MKKASRWTRRGDRTACGERAMLALSKTLRHRAVSLLHRRALPATGMQPRVGSAPAAQTQVHQALNSDVQMRPHAACLPPSCRPGSLQPEQGSSKCCKPGCNPWWPPACRLGCRASLQQRRGSVRRWKPGSHDAA